MFLANLLSAEVSIHQVSVNLCVAEVKIPRAHPVYPVAAESASVSDTLPSDYPSETPSEAEQVHTNQAFMMDESYHSEGNLYYINCFHY